MSGHLLRKTILLLLNHLLSLLCLFVFLAVLHFDFGLEARILVPIGQVPGHCPLLAFIIKVVVVVPCHAVSPVSLNMHLSSH